MELLEAVKCFGLSDKEAKVYLALIGMQSGSAYAVAQKTGLKRPTVYVVMEELQRRGYISRMARTRKSIYKAKSPDELFEKYQRELYTLRQKMPELRAVAKGVSNKIQTFSYEGIPNIHQAIMYGVEQSRRKELNGFYATLSQKSLEALGHFTEFNDTCKKLGITSRGIVPGDKILKEFRDTDTDYKRQRKIVPMNEYSTSVCIEFGDTFVKILDFENYHGIVIENANITKTIREIFEMIWKRV